ncbi:MAG: hypothetical protein LBC75_00625 [Fibromonadaceae bacterium]|jgi:hypothetical protein|nr:hypothetical protein [Fibromonadaceae bacterium]
MPFLYFIFLFLAACSDNLLHSETKPLSLERVSVEVQNKSYIILTDYSIPYSDTILKGDTVFFYAKVNPPGARIKGCHWSIESKDYPCLQARNRYTFDSTGLYPVNLYVLDIFGDTLSANIFMRVSSKPVCGNISLDYFQGSPIFKWNCQNSDDYAELTYRFILKTKDKTDTMYLKEDYLQLGKPLPSDYWEVHLNAENSYGFKDSTELSL